MKCRYTPEFIERLADNEIFVFGSNIQGYHNGGAARVALDKFGAIYGVGVGLQGRSYAIPTMFADIEGIRPYVEQFIRMTVLLPQFTFLVTKIGCGIAGFDISDIAPLFKSALSCKNIILPKEFVDYISLL